MSACGIDFRLFSIRKGVIHMRIDAFNQVSQLYRTNGTKKTGKVGTTVATDKVEISQIGRDFQVAKQAVSKASDVREDRVSAIREQMASGTYNVSMEDVADKLIGSYFAR
jgi:negative regulator of flagellin synthesis FlgM